MSNSSSKPEKEDAGRFETRPIRSGQKSTKTHGKTKGDKIAPDLMNFVKKRIQKKI